MTDLERLARAFVVPLGHDPAKDWARVYVGNGLEADGSLKALCHELARAALTAMRPPSYAMLIAAKGGTGKPKNAVTSGIWVRMIDAALEAQE